MKLPSLTPPKTPSLILLDRDGVINHDVGPPGVIRQSSLRLTPQAGKSIGKLRRAGCSVALITNQSCVGKGLISKEALHDIHMSLQDKLLSEDKDATWDALYCCTSTKEDGDFRMKPSPGMVLEALRDFGVEEKEDAMGGNGLKDCVFVGDNITDLQAAAAGGVGVRILVGTGYGNGLMERAGLGGRLAMVTGADNSFIVDHELNDMHNIPDEVMPFLFVKNLACAVDWLIGFDDDRVSLL